MSIKHTIPPPEETALWRFLKKREGIMSYEQYVLAKDLLDRRKGALGKRGSLLEQAIKAYESPTFAEKYLDKEREKPLLNQRRTIETFKEILKEKTFVINNEKDLWWAKQAFEIIKFSKNKFSISRALHNSIEKYTGQTLQHPLIKTESIKKSQEKKEKKERKIKQPVSNSKLHTPVFFPCVGKTAWDTKEQARLALQAIRRSNTEKGGNLGRTLPLRSYLCNFCGKYHLTSKPYNYHLSK